MRDSFDRYLDAIAGPEGAVRRRPRSAPRSRHAPRRHHLRPRRGQRRPRRRRALAAAARSRFARRARTAGGSARSACRCAACTTWSTPPAPSPWRSSLGVPFEAVRSPLGRFGGVARRFDIRGVDGGATFVDDYAHLPSEIAADIAAARDSGDGWRRVVVAFQPNRFNRIAEMWRDYADAFVGADVVVLTEIYPSGTTPIPGVTGRLDRQRRARRPSPRPRGVAAATRRPGVVPRRRGRSGRRVHLDGMRRHRHAPRGGARHGAAQAEDGVSTGAGLGRRPRRRRVLGRPGDAGTSRSAR